MKKLGKGCLIIVGVFIVLGIIGAVIGGGSARQQTGSASNAPAATSAPQGIVAQAAEAAPTSEPEPAAVAYTVGQDVQVDEVRWNIVQAEELGQTLTSDNQFVKDLNTSGRFVRVQLQVENLSKDMLSFGGVDLQDDQGRTFTSSSDALMFIPDEERCVFENLNPNVAKTCTMIYEVPQNATHIQAQVGDLKILGSEEALIDLGLE